MQCNLPLTFYGFELDYNCRGIKKKSLEMFSTLFRPSSVINEVVHI